MSDRLIPLDGPANFRDLGGYETDHGTCVRPGRVFRSDSLSFMSPEDVRHVTEVLDLRTVIDLRATHEVDQFTHGPLADLPVTVAHMPIVDETRSAPAGWSDGTVMPLDELYLLMLNRFAHRFVSVVRVIAVPESQPVVFHCAAGKDRTGLVAMLLLGVLGVDAEIIAADYALTDDRMPVLMDRHRTRATRDGAEAEVAQQHYAVDAAAMLAVIERVITDYGSIEGYLVDNGLEPDAVATLRATLLA